MACDEDLDETAKKLIKAFMQFRRMRIDENKTGSFGDTHAGGLKHSEIMVLFAIKEIENEHPDGISVSDLSTQLGVKPPTITPMITSLEQKNMLARTMDANDRRIIRIKLKDDGNKFTAKAALHLIERIKGLVNYLGENKSNQLAELINETFEYISANPHFEKHTI